MTEYIGDVEVPAFDQIEPVADNVAFERKYLGIQDPVVIEMEHEVESVSVQPILSEILHTSDLSIGLQRENIHSLLRKPAAANSIDKLDWMGWLSVENINVPRTGSYTSGEIMANYLPYAEFRPGLQIVKRVTDNSFNIERPGVFTLPQSVNNTEVWSKTDTTDLSSKASISTRDGTLDRFTLWSYFSPDDQTLSGGSFSFKEEYGWLREATLSSQGDAATTTGVDAPGGEYRLEVRVSDDNVADDIEVAVVDSGGSDLVRETVSTGTTSITVVESSEFDIPDDETVDLSVTKDTTNTNTIRVDGYWLEPSYTPVVVYNIDLSGDFHAANNTSPVRVFDQDGSTNRNDWLPVHNVEHSFSGEPVVENGILQMDFHEGSIKARRGGSYQKFINQGNYGLNFKNWNFTELSPERVTIRARLEDDDGELWIADFSLDRGKPSFRVEVVQSETTGTTYLQLDKKYSHGASVNKLFSGDQFTGDETIPDTDHWAAGIADAHLAVFGASDTVLNEFYIESNIRRVGYSINEGDTLYFGAYRFPDGKELTDTNPSSGSGNVVNYSEYDSGTDLPHGAYLLGWRVKSDGGEDIDITVENGGSDVSIDDKGATWTTATTTSYDYYLRYYETDNDGTFRTEVSSSSPGAITVDEAIYLPINLDSEIGVQDTSHELLTSLDTKPELLER